jgi:tungstate transport system ATP-binding protein
MAGQNGMILNARDIIKSYPSFTLNINEFELDGGVYFIMGPNGAGKTTFLRVLSGLERIDSGKIYFKGKNIIGNNMSFKGGIYPELVYFSTIPVLWNESAEDNISYGLKLRRFPKSEVIDRVLSISEKLQIKHLLRKSARELSSGESQIVALARTLVLEPDLLLLDEPTANLDVKKTVLLEEMLLKYQSTRNITLLWATHNLFQARRLARFLFFIWEGRIIESGEAKGLFDGPETDELKGFLQGKFY